MTRRFLALAVTTLVIATASPIGAASKAKPAAGEGRSTAVYFLLDDNGTSFIPGPFLVPVARVTSKMTPATEAMQFLLDGPTAAEAASIPGVSSAIPAGTELLDIGISGGVATVDLSGDFESGGGSFSMIARVAQVVFTLTQFETVDGVRFELDGVPTTVFGGEGLIVGDPATRDDFEDLLPAVFLDGPFYGGTPGNPMQLTGLANTFEATFQITITDADGLILTETFATASEGNGVYGDFDVLVDYSVDSPQQGAVIVWVESAMDGSQTDVREYPVALVPAAPNCRGRTATIIGTAGPDTIFGTSGADVIVTFGGNDYVDAGRGRDFVCAGGGDDEVRGFGGGDRVYGQSGDDELIGGGGRDRLRGGSGDDMLRGGAGDDRLVGNGGIDTAVGGSGSDSCVAEVIASC